MGKGRGAGKKMGVSASVLKGEGDIEGKGERVNNSKEKTGKTTRPYFVSMAAAID